MQAIKKPVPVGTEAEAYEEIPHIRIVHRPAKKRKSFRQIAVKGLTIGIFLVNLYAIMLMEFHPQIGVPLWGVTFLYILAFLKANGGLGNES